jgi:hypothetical protein
LFAQQRARRLRASVLPHDRVVQRLAGTAIAWKRGFALVGDADGGHLARGEAGFR